MTIEVHPEYQKFSPLWKKARLANEGQHSVHNAGELFLPKTSGMRKKKYGDDIYKSYVSKARFHPLTQGFINTIIGLATQNDLVVEVTHDRNSVTKNGLSVEMLTHQCIENVALIGRHILVNDAYEGRAYIVQYKAESMSDWAVDEYNNFVWARFQEEYNASLDVTERDIQIRYREYLLDDGKWVAYTKDESGEYLTEKVEIAMPLKDDGTQYEPITVIGSRSNQPDVDIVPSLPIVESCIAAYQLSADYRQGLHGSTQPTAYATGIQEDDVDRIMDQGVGTGSFWAFSSDLARVGYLETSAESLSESSDEIERELNHGKEQALKVVQTSGEAETATAVTKRTNGQRVTAWTMFASISEGIQRALMILDKMQAHNKEVLFEIKAEYNEADASHSMLTALNNVVNSGNLPSSVIHQWARDNNYTELSNEEIAEQISTQPVTGLIG